MQRDLGTKATSISKSEVDDYIQAHPAQFANRHLYQIEQISFPPQKDMENLASATKDFTSLDQVEQKLNQLDIKFSRGTGTMDTATLPPEMQKAIDARKPQDIFFVRSRTNATFFKVDSVDSKPLTGDEADQFAKRQLREELARKTSVDTFNAALAAAKYEGDYARIMALPTPGAPAAPAAGEAPAAEGQTGEKPVGEGQAGEKPAEPASGAKTESDKEAPKN